jgi:hypothetical protein
LNKICAASYLFFRFTLLYTTFRRTIHVFKERNHMSQFIYQFNGKQRPAPIAWETITYKLTGAKGRVYWSDRTDTAAMGIEWMPLGGAEGTITGAGLLRGSYFDNPELLKKLASTKLEAEVERLKAKARCQVRFRNGNVLGDIVTARRATKLSMAASCDSTALSP